MKKMSLTLLFVGALFSAQASAAILSGNVTYGSGSFVELSIPFTESSPNNTVGNNTFQDRNLYAFNEGQNIELLSDLDVDFLAATGTSGSLSTGTIVASHYVFFDPRNSRHQEGNVTFDSAVLAIITSSGLLSASDFLLNNGVNYLNPGLRGLEANDSASVCLNSETICVDWTASTPGDYIRVLTEYSPLGAQVPVPTAAILFAPVLLGFMGLRRSLSNKA